MRVEFTRPDDPAKAIAVAEWDGIRAVTVEAADEEARAALGRIFRIASVAIEDGSRKPMSARGPILSEPGDLDWFMAAARVRGEKEGFAVRFSTDTPGGWDPAAYYRRLGPWLERREAAPRR